MGRESNIYNSSFHFSIQRICVKEIAGGKPSCRIYGEIILDDSSDSERIYARSRKDAEHIQNGESISLTGPSIGFVFAELVFLRVKLYHCDSDDDLDQDDDLEFDEFEDRVKLDDDDDDDESAESGSDEDDDDESAESGSDEDDDVNKKSAESESDEDDDVNKKSAESGSDEHEDVNKSNGDEEAERSSKRVKRNRKAFVVKKCYPLWIHSLPQYHLNSDTLRDVDIEYEGNIITVYYAAVHVSLNATIEAAVTVTTLKDEDENEEGKKLVVMSNRKVFGKIEAIQFIRYTGSEVSVLLFDIPNKEGVKPVPLLPPDGSGEFGNDHGKNVGMIPITRAVVVPLAYLEGRTERYTTASAVEEAPSGYKDSTLPQLRIVVDLHLVKDDDCTDMEIAGNDDDVTITGQADISVKADATYGEPQHISIGEGGHAQVQLSITCLGLKGPVST